ncbi:MAG TPA: hypothetical protein PKI85_08605 [Chitinophagaceae bacterium]|nr:hypothetical protein [Chitinophagaceae bacterium]HNK61331.1 hypothetical protein [Chitinophagaceae bacterium]HNO55158.1 hypothetical protein [Chitinophagaceae bacterium]
MRMEQKEKLKYPLLHWLITIAMGPFAIALYEVFFVSAAGARDVLSFYYLFCLFGLGYSLPLLAIYIITFLVLEHKIKNIFLLKSLLIFIAALMMFLLSRLLAGDFFNEISLSYLFVLIVSGFLIKIRSKESETMA